MIRSSGLSLKNANQGKLETVRLFIQEYRKAVQSYVDYLWITPMTWGKEPNVRIWNREAGQLDLPSMISTVGVTFDTKLSGRALKCAATQACGIVGAVVNKRKRDLFKATKLEEIHLPISKRLSAAIQTPVTKPVCSAINCEINSVVCSLSEEGDATGFDLWLTLSSIFNTKEKGRGFKVVIPLQKHRQYKKWSDLMFGQQLSSVLLNEDKVVVRFEVEPPATKGVGETVAIDQGKITCLTMSDGCISTKNKHGHDLNTILRQLSRCKKGSQGFRRAESHRTNYINWAVNQINLSNVKEFKVEEIVNISYGRRVSRHLSHWVNSQIRDSLKKRCEENGVRFTLVRNEYNSQRCSKCGWVHKLNRKSKVFHCRKCSFELDADFNASQNILYRDTLADIPYELRYHKYNMKGFFWLPQGLYFDNGEEITVPPSPKSDHSIR